MIIESKFYTCHFVPNLFRTLSPRCHFLKFLFSLVQLFPKINYFLLFLTFLSLRQGRMSYLFSLKAKVKIKRNLRQIYFSFVQVKNMLPFWGPTQFLFLTKVLLSSSSFINWIFIFKVPVIFDRITLPCMFRACVRPNLTNFFLCI